MKAKLTEAEFTRQVLELAKLCQWKTAHFRPAKTAKGWRTPVQGDGKGFPDLVLVKSRTVWVELKTDDGKLTEEQKAWMQALFLAKQEFYIWRPKDWNAIETFLKDD